MLNPGDSTPLLEVVSGVGFTSVSAGAGASGSGSASGGYVLGMDRAIVDGAAVWVHSREDGTGGLKVSTQFMYVDSSVLASYQTSEAMAGAANSYGGINTQAVYLQPRSGVGHVGVVVPGAVVPGGTGSTDSGNGGSTETPGGGNPSTDSGQSGSVTPSDPGTGDETGGGSQTGGSAGGGDPSTGGSGQDNTGGDGSDEG